MAEFYQRYCRDALNGMSGLTWEERGVYDTALDRMYEEDGPISLDMLARENRSARRDRLEKIVAALVAKEKLQWTADGHLTNSRAEYEIDRMTLSQQERRERGRKGAHKRWRAQRRQAELFPEPVELPAEKGNNFNGHAVAQPSYAGAHVRGTGAQVPSKSSGTGVEVERNPSGTQVPRDLASEKPNDFNGRPIAELAHIDRDIEIEEDIPPVVPHGKIEPADEFAIPAKSDRAKRKSRMPAGWNPDYSRLSDRVQAITAHWDDAERERVAHEFMLYAEAKEPTYANWDAAFAQSCIRYDEQRHRRTHGRPEYDRDQTTVALERLGVFDTAANGTRG